ncbi:MAG TPA: alpha/beta fold hydrolase [Firmicutes bacterium]|nr:alpha/beta fold hydrolase [Bacillota bacterium]
MTCVLLHGLGQGPSSWDGVREALPPHLPVVCPSLGEWLAGREAVYADLFRGWEAYASRLDGPLVLCGLSLGGVLALDYTLRHPERVAALALIATPIAMPKTLLTVQNLLFRLLPSSAFAGMGLAKKQALSLCRSMKELDFRRQVGSLSCPVAAICGERDRTNRPAAQELARRVSHARLILLEGAGHEANSDNPLRLGEALGAFFTEQGV